jgi:hypothetical protein
LAKRTGHIKAEELDMKFYIALAAALTMGSALSLAADAPADDASGGTKHRVCAADVQKFCAGIEHGQGRIRDCLIQHTSELSDACKQRMSERAQKSTPPAN